VPPPGPDGSVYAFLADHRRELFLPELSADLVVQGRSHPSVPAAVVATVMVLQALEGLSDREAVSALRRDITWKVACGLVPYRGIDRNDLWWSVRVAAVNLRRLLALGLARQDQTWVLA
jgi:hypothetical protein